MMSGADPARDLALQIRTELAEAAPQGFHFNDHLIRQDAALLRLTDQLRALDPTEVEAAVRRALEDERDGWTLLKLLELTERLELKEAAGPLMKIAEAPPGEGDRQRFLAGRACEVMLKLPLDLATRTRANEVCKIPLEDIARFRLGAAQERVLHRPRQAEWTLLVILMALALAGLAFAWLALGR